MNDPILATPPLPAEAMPSAQNGLLPTMELDMSNKLARMDELLEAAYRSGHLATDDLAVAAYLLISDQCRVVTGRRVFVRLRQRYPRWRDILGAPIEDIEEILGPSGSALTKGQALKELLQKVCEANDARPAPGRRRDLNLDFLKSLPRSEGEEFLNDFPLLSNLLLRNALAIDTNARRILARMGLRAGREGDPDPIAAVPAHRRTQLRTNLIHHGRAVCRAAGKPRCGECVLVSFCEQGRKTVGLAAAAGPKQAKRQPPTAIDLFGGAGGLGSGFRQAGFRVLLAIEAERSAAQTYRLNNPGTIVVETEIDQTTTGNDLLSMVPGVNKVAALLAGPPCQGYSMAGWRRPDDPKNYLFQHVARIAGEVGVDVVAMENVPGMKNVGGRSFIDAVKDAFREAGLEADHQLLRASDFGVPQHRRRIFFLARRQGLPAIGEPLATHLRHGEVRKARDKNGQCCRCGHHPPRRVSSPLADSADRQIDANAQCTDFPRTSRSAVGG
jgi:DNA (cytosine-5)-methyltransferase 1